jgi:outer membrane protein
MFETGLRRAAVLCVAVLGSLGILSAQAKIAVISLQRAVLDTAEIKKAQAELEAKFKPRQEQMEKLSKELQGIQNQLQSLQGKLTPQAEQELTVQGQRKQRELQRMSEDLQADVDRERNEILSRSGQRMQAVVKQLAEEKGYDVVVDVNDTVFYKPVLEITKDAVAAYDKAHPPK